MSKTTIQVKVTSHLSDINRGKLVHLARDYLANITGKEFQFYRHGDAMDFEQTCEDLGVEYQVTDLSDD